MTYFWMNPNTPSLRPVLLDSLSGSTLLLQLIPCCLYHHTQLLCLVPVAIVAINANSQQSWLTRRDVMPSFNSMAVQTGRATNWYPIPYLDVDYIRLNTPSLTKITRDTPNGRPFVLLRLLFPWMTSRNSICRWNWKRGSKHWGNIAMLYCWNT